MIRLIEPRSLLLIALVACTFGRDAAAREPKSGGTTLINETKLAPTVWTDEYLAEVRAGMKVGDVGKTTVDYTYTYQFGYGSDAERIVSCEVIVTIGVGLAEWKHYGRRPAADREWDRFVGELARHEQGHVEIAKRLFEGAADRCLGKSAAECQAALDAIMQREHVEQRAYDRDTEHGVRTGAALAGSDKRPTR